MSTPSTATAVHPPHSLHYGYSNHQAYQSNGGYYSANNLTNGHPRLASSYNSFPTNSSPVHRTSTTSTVSRQPQPHTLPTSQSIPGMQTLRKRDRRPDWDDFYKNGPPKEIIVIDDESPPPVPTPVEYERSEATRNGVTNVSTQHPCKKRRTGQAAPYDPVRCQEPSYTRTPQYGETPTTMSTDRTTSLQTTAPTSLGSHGSGNSRTYLEEGNVGQKRKRQMVKPVTRRQTAEDKKRQEIDVVGSAYSSYVPPPKPPIKAKEVAVAPIRDVSRPLC